MDPLADMLTQIRNAQAVGRETVELPYSKLKEAVGRLLQQEGYLGEVRVFKPEGRSYKRLSLKLRYIDGVPAISHLTKVSKPGQRIYLRKNVFPKALGGPKRVIVVSTSRGLMTIIEAAKRDLGGEILVVVW